MTTNFIDAQGLTIQTLTQIVAELETGFKTIYGQDINLDANSPDAQMINLFAQAKIDVLDAISQVYNSFSPTAAVGAVLDQRCAINGVVRQGATNTVIEAVVLCDRVTTLVGLSSDSGTPFTIADGQGNNFLLVDDQATVIGSNTFQFIAEVAGAVAAVPNTVTTIATVTLGALSVNNPDDPITQGTNEETDAQLRFRRQRSVALPSSGYIEGLTSGLLAILNVVDAKVYENTTGITDVNGIPGHSIWCVVDGGDDDAIAQVIYVKRNAGCGMKGDEEVAVLQPNGFNIQIKFDRPELIDLYIELTLTSIDPAHLIDDGYIKQQIFDRVLYKIYEPADYTEITSIVKGIDPLAVVLSGGVSEDNVTFDPFLYPSTLAGRYIISTARINVIVV